MRIRSTLQLAPVLLLTAVSIAACSGSIESGKAQPRSEVTKGASATGREASNGPQKLRAPAVPKPLNAKPFFDKDEICKIVNQNQAKRLGLEKPYVKERVAASNIVGCTYSDKSNKERRFTVNFGVGNKRGLSYIYLTRLSYDTWKTFKVQNYPAVTTDDDGSLNLCNSFVGVTDTLMVRIYYADESGGSVKSCSNNKDLANAVISNLKLQE